MIRDWYTENQTKITWFVIGVLTMSVLDSLARQEYGWAAFSAFIAWLNYAVDDIELTK